MAFDQHYYILLGVIMLLALFGLIGNVQLGWFYQSWLNKLKEFERKKEFQLEENPSHLIQEMVNEYSHHRLQGIEWVNSQALIEHSVYKRHFLFLGFIRLPVHTVEKIVAQLPSWTIILGLLGTFSGLTIALFAMQNTLLQLGTSSTAEVISVSAIVAAIAEPFKGMSFAFITSIAGIGAAFLMHLFHSGLFSRLGVGPNTAQLKNLFMTRCETFLDHQVQLAVQSQKPKDSLERVLDRLVDKVKESFDHSVERFGDEILNLTEKLDGSIQGIEQVVSQSIQFTEQFHQGTSHLTQFGQVLKASIQDFKNQENLLGKRVDQLSKQIQLLQNELKQLTIRGNESSQSLQKVVERSDQLIQDSLRKSEEVYQFFQQQMEESQRQFQNRFDENQRQSQQQQEAWVYKYNEKNDQFSRAAESFSQAVSHLERVWSDGMERFKREMSVQWAQVMEKYLSRGQHDDKETREVVRELASMQHLIEREFQQLHRYSQEISHLLGNMYDWGRSQLHSSMRAPVEPRYEASDRVVHADSVRQPMVKERRY
jgi:hypothetical protein